MSEPLAGGSPVQGFLYSPPTSGKPPDPVARRHQRQLGLVLVIGDVVVGLAVAIPVGLLSANFALGGIVGFGAMMVFGVASIFVAVFHDFHARPSKRPRQP